MDFHSLSRRELQSLCMSNGIKANMTNVAMADALKSLQTVEGISETPRKAEPKSEMPKAGRRAASSRQVGSARPHEPQGSPLPRSRRVTARLGAEILNLAADADEGKDKEEVTETPRAPTTRRRAQGKKEDAVESTIPKTTTTRRRATKKEEEEKTVGVTTRRRTRQTLKKEAEVLDVAIGTNAKSSIRGKSALKMADLENDIAQVLPIEQSKEEGEEKDAIEDVLSNDPSMEEETVRVQEKEEKEITQVLPIEQPEEDQLGNEEEQQIILMQKNDKDTMDTISDEQISSLEEETDSTKEENHAEGKEQDDEERGEAISAKEDSIDDDAISAITEESPDENLDNSETYHKQEQLDSSNELMLVPESKEDSEEDTDDDDDAISATTEESPIKGLVSPCKQQQDIAEYPEEEGRREANTEVPYAKGVTETVGDSNQLLEVGTVDFSAGKAAEDVDGSGDFAIDNPVEIDDFGNEDASFSSLVTCEIAVKTTEKFDLFPLSVSDNNNNKENPTGGDGRQKKIEPKTMSLRKLKARYKESLINKKVEEKRSALKPLEENLLTTSMEDAVM